VYSNIGYNLKLTDMQAAVGLSQLKRVDGFIAARRNNYRALSEGIKSSPLLGDMRSPVEPTDGTNPRWFGFPLHCRKGLSRDAVDRYRDNHDVGTRVVLAGNTTRQPAYRNVGFRAAAALQNPRRIADATVWVGVQPLLDDER